MRKPLLLLLPLLWACTPPLESCIATASRDLLVVRSLIADTEATISRGYAIQTEERLITYTDFCIGARKEVGVTFCNRIEPVTSRNPVAVDLDEERRKLRSLRRKEVELTGRTATQIAQCKAQYPDT